jgi:hypothetical protein
VRVAIATVPGCNKASQDEWWVLPDAIFRWWWSLHPGNVPIRKAKAYAGIWGGIRPAAGRGREAPGGHHWCLL